MYSPVVLIKNRGTPDKPVYRREQVSLEHSRDKFVKKTNEKWF